MVADNAFFMGNDAMLVVSRLDTTARITSYNVCYTKLLRIPAFRYQDEEYGSIELTGAFRTATGSSKYARALMAMIRYHLEFHPETDLSRISYNFV